MIATSHLGDAAEYVAISAAIPDTVDFARRHRVQRPVNRPRRPWLMNNNAMAVLRLACPREDLWRFIQRHATGYAAAHFNVEIAMDVRGMRRVRHRLFVYRKPADASIQAISGVESAGMTRLAIHPA